LQPDRGFISARPGWSAPAVDADVYASPLVVGGRVIVATENNSVYAFDLDSGRQAWMTHVGQPVDAGRLPCGNIKPISGITGTPVADTAGGVLYAVAFLQPGRHELFAIDLMSGSVRFHQAVDPPGEDPLTHQQRAALALSGGYVYIAYGGLLGDCGRYHGNVVGVPRSGGPQLSYRVPCGRACGIWAPSGPAVDSDGNLYVATGNSDATSTFDHGESVIKLSPQLKELDVFAPTDWAALNRDDRDLGSIGPALVDGGRVYISGKGSIAYLLAASHLGGVGGQLASLSLPCPTFGGTAYAGQVLYAACTSSVVAVRINADRMSVAWRRPIGNVGAPIVVAGAVWSVDLSSGKLHALDPASGEDRYQLNVGAVQHFTTLAAGPGRVLIVGARRLQAIEVTSG
jgi:outer membrane protein assembly factor BamB